METGNNPNDTLAIRMVVVADDFTGACDTGVQFGKNHRRTLMVSSEGDMDVAVNNCDVLVVNTDSRLDDTDTAYGKVYRIGQRLAEKNIRYFYKKLDSTMRGNIGAELSAMMDSFGIETAFLAPALPQYGRTTLFGKVYLNGILLEDTDMAKDPRNPVRESLIPKIIGRQTTRKTAVIIHDHIVAGKQVLTEKIQHHIKTGVSIIIFDAADEKDLELIASVTTLMGDKVLFAGCSGLAGHLVNYLSFPIMNKSGIVIAGSANEVTRTQIGFAARYLKALVIDIDVVKILSGSGQQERKKVLDLVEKAVRQGTDIIVRSAPDKDSVKRSFEAGERFSLSSVQVAEKIADFLGNIAATVIREMNISGALLTGGDTAMKSSNYLGSSGVILENEIMHGIPYGRFVDPGLKDRIIVSKAGGFGAEDAIFRILNFLKNG